MLGGLWLLFFAKVVIFVIIDSHAHYNNSAYSILFSAVTDSYDWDNTQSALADIEKNTENSVRVKNYANAFAMADALFAGEVDALLINSAYVDILTEMETLQEMEL